MGRTLGSVGKADGPSRCRHRSCPCLPPPTSTNLYLPEHHLDGRFWPLWSLLQAPRGVPVAGTGVTIPEPRGSSNLPDCVLTRRETRVPPCPALHTELAPPESRSFLSPLPSLFHHTGTGYTHLTSPTPFPPSQAAIHPERLQPPQGELVKDLPTPTSGGKKSPAKGPLARGFWSLRSPSSCPFLSGGTTETSLLRTQMGIGRRGWETLNQGRAASLGRAWTRPFLSLLQLCNLTSPIPPTPASPPWQLQLLGNPGPRKGVRLKG